MSINSRKYSAILFSLIALNLILSMTGTPCKAAISQLHQIRYGDHSDFTRLVFDIQGDRPARVGPPASDSIAIDFNSFKTSIKPAKLPYRFNRFVSGIRFQQISNSFKVVIAFQRDASVNYFFLDSDPPRPGWYRLVMDFSLSSRQKKDAADQSAGKTEKQQGKKLSANSALDPSGQAKARKPPVSDENKPSSDPVPPSAEPPSPIVQTPADAMFQAADSIFAEHQDNLPDKALQIAQQYEAAIRSNPKAPQVPLALYRSALAHKLLGDKEKAEAYFRRLISDYPGHTIVPLAWMGLGRLQLERNNCVEAIEALRVALTSPLEKSDGIEAHYQLGKAFYCVDAHQDAVENLNECLAQDPQSYLERPDLLKLLGESLFAVKQYPDSSKYLLHYLNLQEDAAERDMILARIAENLRQQGENGLAEKLYAFIEKHHPNSEGYIITQLRKAESLEAQNSNEAHQIYQKLAQNPLSVPLMKLVTFKLASWEWQHQNYKESLAQIDGVLRGRVNAAEFDEFLTLRQKVVQDWAMAAFFKKDYLQVVQLFREHEELFQAAEKEELYTAVAESYGQLKLYPEAVDVYQTLLAKTSSAKHEWLINAARYAFLAGDLDKAEQQLSQIRKTDMGLQELQLKIEIDFANKEYQRTVEQFENLAKNQENLSRIELPVLLHYGESLIRLKRHKDALDYLDKASSRLENEDAELKVQVCLLQSECYQALQQPQNAVAVLEEAIALTASEELKNQFNYQLSKLYAQTGQMDKATEKLSYLMKSPQPFWKNVAQQALNHLQLQRSGPNSNSS